MRIAVVGTGGIGGPYGASFAEAGVDVTFVTRGTHLAAIRENGLGIEGDRGETHMSTAAIVSRSSSISAALSASARS
jgi:2-dehydropantoate 2-reductase